MKRSSVWALLGAFGLSIIGQAPAAELAVPPWLDHAFADTLVRRCAASSQANGWPPFTFAVVDAGGALLLLLRQDGASSVTADAAVMKARTAARFGAPTQALVAASQDAPTRDLLMLLQLTDDPGGVPLKSGGHVIGALGVSGGTAEQDTGCTHLALGTPTSEKK